MLTIEVFPPFKNDNRYEFKCRLSCGRTPGLRPVDRLKRLVKGVIKGGISPDPSLISFGFVSLNYAIRHSELWDSVYPLMHLTRNGGPLFNTVYQKARILFRYPILRKVKDFYVQRARNFGLEITVEGRSYDARFDWPLAGHAVAFGGGKESRLIYGVLGELGYSPTAYTAVGASADDSPDMPDAKRVTAIDGSLALANRIMPAFMSGCEKIYLGGDLANAVVQNPWVQYHDYSPRPLKEFSSLIGSLGVRLECFSPTCVLPTNLVQKILYERYPKLYKYQYSVRKNDPLPKNFFVALCKFAKGISFEKDCSQELFVTLLHQFVQSSIENPEDFGFHRCMEFYYKERRALIHRLSHHPLLREVKDKIPENWKADWIDVIHTYVDPGLDPRILAIFDQYAPRIEKFKPDGAGRLPGYNEN